MIFEYFLLFFSIFSIAKKGSKNGKKWKKTLSNHRQNRDFAHERPKIDLDPRLCGGQKSGFSGTPFFENPFFGGFRIGPPF